MKRNFRKIIPIIIAALSIVFTITLFCPVSAKAANKTVRASTEKALNKAIKDPDVTDIYFRTNAYINVTIKSNKSASSKYLTIDAPNADITNKSVFKGIFIQESGNYIESADGNTFEIYDTSALKSFTVAKKKTVKSLTYINPGQDLARYYYLRNGAQIEELYLFYSDGGTPGQGIFDPLTRIMVFNYINKDDAHVSLTYVLDQNGRVINFKNNHPEFGCEYAYDYDDDGYIVKETFNDMIGKGSTTYEYTSDHKLAKTACIAEITNDVLKYNYDKKGNLISTEHCSDGSGKFQKETVNKYDKNGRLLSRTYTANGNTDVQEYKYNKKGFLTSYSVHSKGGTITEYKMTISYKYNSAGDIIKKTVVENGKKTVTKYKYDKLGNRI